MAASSVDGLATVQLGLSPVVLAPIAMGEQKIFSTRPEKANEQLEINSMLEVLKTLICYKEANFGKVAVREWI